MDAAEGRRFLWDERVRHALARPNFLLKTADSNSNWNGFSVPDAMKPKCSTFRYALIGLALFAACLPSPLHASDEGLSRMMALFAVKGMVTKIAPMESAFAVVAKLILSWLFLWGCAHVCGAGATNAKAALKVLLYLILLDIAWVILLVVGLFLAIASSQNGFPAGMLVVMSLFFLALLLGGSVMIVAGTMETGVLRAIGILIIAGILGAAAGAASDYVILGKVREKIASLIERDIQRMGETEFEKQIRSGKLVDEYRRELAREPADSAPSSDIGQAPAQTQAVSESREQLQQRLMVMYEELKREREALDVKNREAVAAFNRRAAEYAALKARLSDSSATRQGTSQATQK